jgi:hypothetical protein
MAKSISSVASRPPSLCVHAPGGVRALSLRIAGDVGDDGGGGGARCTIMLLSLNTVGCGGLGVTSL